jgi:hypothetical protein
MRPRWFWRARQPPKLRVLRLLGRRLRKEESGQRALVRSGSYLRLAQRKMVIAAFSPLKLRRAHSNLVRSVLELKAYGFPRPAQRRRRDKGRRRLRHSRIVRGPPTVPLSLCPQPPSGYVSWARWESALPVHPRAVLPSRGMMPPHPLTALRSQRRAEKGSSRGLAASDGASSRPFGAPMVPPQTRMGKPKTTGHGAFSLWAR